MPDIPGQPDETRSVSRLPNVATITNVRDLLLMLGGATYLAGYATWAVFSYSNGLGPMPALDLQYVVAGVPPILALALSATLYPWLRASLRSGKERRPLWYRILSAPGVSTLTMLLAVTFLAGLSERFPRLTSVAFLVFFPLWMSTQFLAFDEWGERQSWLGHGRSWLGLGLSVGASFCFSIVIYASTVFTIIPQSLGGGAPRCARLELAREGTGLRSEQELKLLDPDLKSEEGLKKTLERDSQNVERAVVDTAPVSVWQVTDDWILVKTGLGGLLGKSIQLPTSQVKSIHWLETSTENGCL